MNSEDIYDGITDIRDDQVDGAKKNPKPRIPRWIFAVAAMFAIVITTAMLFRPDDRLPVHKQTDPVETTAVSVSGENPEYYTASTLSLDDCTTAAAVTDTLITTTIPTTAAPPVTTTVPTTTTSSETTEKSTDTTASIGSTPKATQPVKHIEAKPLAVVNLPEQVQYPNYPQKNYSDEEYKAWSDAYDKWYEQNSYRRELCWVYEETLNHFNDVSVPQMLIGAQDENRVYSPLNTYLALSMLAEATGGTSREQILELLDCGSIEEVRTRANALWQANYCDDGKDTSLLANSLWLNSSLSDCYNNDTLQTLADTYYASSFCGTMGDEDYNDMLHKWINDNTGGRLGEQSNGLKFDSETVLGLVSTIYFRGEWGGKFNADRTYPEIFHAHGEDLTVDFMHQRIEDTSYYWGDGFSSMVKGLGNASMWFFLPNEGVSVDEVLASGQVTELLASKHWENYADANINLSLPKFDVVSDLDLKDTLKALGVTDVFEENKANFYPTVSLSDANVYLKDVKHAARVTIDEEGAEGVAYTFMSAVTESALQTDPIEVDFIVDRPFIFAIRAHDGSILFAGVVNNPSA